MRRRWQPLFKSVPELHGLQDKFGEILVPTEEVVEMRSGEKRTSERMFFPGYVLVNMELDDDTWH
jgi:transcriptional antiterminator NusG